jgi:protein O-mannosyl-transferase
MRSNPSSLVLPGLLLGLALCIAVYYPGLYGGFIFDDGPNIVLNDRLQSDELTAQALHSAAISTDSGALRRPLSTLSFWANYYTTGLDPFYFKLTNLLIHLLNGAGLFWFAKLLLQSIPPNGESVPPTTRDGIALAAALLWLLHPLNVTSVLYVVQRMTSLSATFTICGLVTYMLGRQRLARDQTGFPLIFLGLFGFGSLAVLSKENGALLPLYLAAIELALLRFSGLAPDARRKVKAFFLVTVAAPALAVIAFLAVEPTWLTQQYAPRDFTLIERLLTQARILWLYLAWLAAPTRASLGLFHDDVATSYGLLDPPTTLFAIAGLVCLCATAIRWRQRAPLFTFAVAWFFVGHLLESSVIALELVHEHRNYMPIFGPLLAGAYFLSRLSASLPAKAQFALPAVFLTAFSGVTFARSLDWSNVQRLQIASARDHPNSVRSNNEAGAALGFMILKNPDLASTLYDDAKTYFERAATLDGATVAPLFGRILLDTAARRPVDEALIERIAARLKEMPIRFIVVEPFRALVDWTSQGVVELPETLVVKLFESAIGNPSAGADTRAMLLSLLSSYHYNVTHDVQNAVSLALAAVEESPADPVHHVSLATLALRLGNRDLARQEIDAARHVDAIGRFDIVLAELAQSLAKADSGAQSAANETGLR